MVLEEVGAPCRYMNTLVRAAGASRCCRSSPINLSMCVPPAVRLFIDSFQLPPSSSKAVAGTSRTTLASLRRNPRRSRRPALTRARTPRSALLNQTPPQIALPLAAAPHTSFLSPDSLPFRQLPPVSPGGGPPWSARPDDARLTPGTARSERLAIIPQCALGSSDSPPSARAHSSSL
jgi:hypothetical protein